VRGLHRHLVVLAAAAALFPAVAQAEIKSMWGPATLPDGKSAFPVYRDLGVEDLQVVLRWRAAAPGRPADARDPADAAYAWPADVDRTVESAREHGIGVTLMLMDTPPWANGGKDARWAPDDAKDFADFAVAAARRYRHVHRWMIWGEPNRQGNFQPLPKGKPTGPRRYARLLDAAYGALKGVSKRNVVIGGMTFTSGDVPPRSWLRWSRLPSGKPPRLDWWGHNPFSTRFPDLSRRPYRPGLLDFCDLDTLHALLRRTYSGRPTPKLWLSEFTIQSDHGSGAFDWYVSRRGQARWVTAAFAIAHREPWIAGLGWLQLVDEPENTGRTNAHWGLLTEDGKRKPAYDAYRRAR
jgi:hypothetical protein